MSLGATLTHRLARAVPTMLAASALMFVVLMVGPNPLATLAQEAGDVDTAAIAHANGWDRPWLVQYGDWLGGLARGDWGTSVRTNEPAREMVLECVPLTLGLTLASTLVSCIAAVLLGAWSALHRDTRRDRLTTGSMVAISALPSFLIALALQWMAVQLKDLTGHTILYVGGMPRDGGAVESLQRFAIPVLVLSLVQIAAWMRFQRSELIEVLGRDFLQAARAKGLPGRVVLVRHALRCALVPLITIVALDLGTTLGGALVVETIFGLPGLGRLLVDSVQAKDVVVTLDIVVIAAFAIVVATTAADVLTARLDPRITERKEVS